MTDQRTPRGERPLDPEATEPYSTLPAPGSSALPPPPPPPPPGFPSVDAGEQPPSGRNVLPLALLAGLLIALGAVALVWGGLLGPRGTVDPLPSPSQVAVASPSHAAQPTLATPSAVPSPSTAVATDAPSPAPVAPSAEPSPSGTGGPAPSDLPIDPAIADRIEAVTEQVPPIRGLEALADVPFRFIGEERFTNEFRALFREENPPKRVAAEEALLKRLGLLEPDADLEELILSLYGSQVAAFYDPRTGVFTVVQREGFEFGADDEIVVAHEYDHALQDQHFHLEATDVTDPAEGDRALANLALIEGDATVLMLDWAGAHLDFDALLEALGSSLSPADQELLDRMPPVLRRQLEFPYIDGFAFVTALRAGGDWSSVDDAFRNDRPVSTEQILHPDKYAAGEAPVNIDMPDLAARLGDGWRESYRQTMGELLIGVFVADGQQGPPAIPGLPSQLPNAEAAAGWGGDRLVSLDGLQGAWAVSWESRWDTNADATEFADAAEVAVADLPGRHVIARGTDFVRILVASDPATLDLVRAAYPVD